MITEAATDTPAPAPPTSSTPASPARPTPARATSARPLAPHGHVPQPAPPPRPAGRRLWALLRTVVVTVLVLGLVTLVCPGLLGAWSVRAEDAVPRSIDLAWRWQASVEDDPPGPAAVVATFEEPAASVPAVGAAPADSARPVMVVGRNGVYRAIYPQDGLWHAGDDVHLSPDGRWLAAPYLHDPATARRGPTIIDLTTGTASVVATAGLPAQGELVVLAWRPDGAALLVASVVGRTAHVAVLDLATRQLTELIDLPAPGVTRDWRVAFAPDGRRVAFSASGSLYLVDDQGDPLWTVPLAGGRLLAGEGAFTPDGRRIALVHPLPCSSPCTGAPNWAVTYVDSTDGSATQGPVLPAIKAAQVRAVGWSPGRDETSPGLVVIRHLPHPPAKPSYVGPTGAGGADAAEATPAAAPVEPAGDGPADLFELIPGEPPQLLLDAPYEVTRLEVAADLVRLGRLDGEPSMPSLLPIEADRVRPIDVLVTGVILGALAAVVAVMVSLTGRLVPSVRALRSRRASVRPRPRSARS